MSNFRKFLLLCSAFFALIFLAQKTVVAQEKTGLDLTVNPAIIELSTPPGTAVVQKFRIRNNLSRAIKLKLSVDKMTGDSNGQVQPVKAEPGDTSTTWVSFDKTSFTALPQEWTDVAVTLKVPADATFGYYYAIRISQSSEDVKEKSNNTVLGEIALPVLLAVKKEGAERNAQLVSFKTESYINEYLPVNFVTTVLNNGNVHVKPRGNIFIRNSSDKDQGILDVNAELGSILPGSKRDYKSTWTDGFMSIDPVVEDGVTRNELHISWDKLTKIRFGKYQANLILVYDNGKRDVPIEATTTFWVFPYTLVGISLLIVIVLFLGLRFLLKLYIKKQVRKYSKSANSL